MIYSKVTATSYKHGCTKYKDIRAETAVNEKAAELKDDRYHDDDYISVCLRCKLPKNMCNGEFNLRCVRMANNNGIEITRGE